MSLDDRFLCGVVEGFYGQPWTQSQRHELFEWLSGWNLNSYLYAPKDDLKHRALWREDYSTDELLALGALVRRCESYGLRFIYALAPGLDITYSAPSDLDFILTRFNQLLSIGCADFALLFDDIPPHMSVVDRKRFDSFASAHARLANAVFSWLRSRVPEDSRFLFCPTPYCGRMALREIGGPNYLETLGKELFGEIDVLWTGPEIISRTIEPADIPVEALRRKPVLWDNLHANDYDRSRFYAGPYAGRSWKMKECVNGILSNPNNEFALNYIPVRTLALFVASDEDWNPRSAYEKAVNEWEPRFKTARQQISSEALRLFLDCYYLPHEDGADAKELLASAEGACRSVDAEHLSDFRAAADRLREFCHGATELVDRGLFYALSQRVWDLREEMDLLERYIEAQVKGSGVVDNFSSDFHLPQTYRGGFVRKLQRLLVQKEGGSFQRAKDLSE